MLQITVLIAVVLAIAWLILYMRAQKPVTSAQGLIQQGRYADAVSAATDDSAGSLHKAEALKLLGRFDEAVAAYMRSDDPAAREGIALALAHQQTDLDRSRRLMEETIARYPQIQEFQALGLAYIHLRNGDRDAALRLYRDHRELLETRFHDDYTDRDPLLAETLWMYGVLADADGDSERARVLKAKAAEWAPGSWFAQQV